MLSRIIEFSLKHRLWVLVGVGTALVIGLFSLATLPIDAVPDITNTQVVINTRTGALDPEQAEKTVTYYIESEMAGLPGVVDIRSHTKAGLSHVVVIFRDGTNIYWARQLVSEKLQNIRELLPAGLSPEMGPITAGLGEVLIYAVSAKKGSPLARKSEKERLMYLRTVNDFIIRPYLKSNLQNIAEVDVLGGYRREIHVDIIPNRLVRHGITMGDILKKLDTLGENSGGGYIENRGRQVIVRTEGTMKKIEQIRSLPVKLSVFGAPVRLGDIAYVREDHAQRFGAATLNGSETIIGTVLMLQGANSRQVAADAERTLGEIVLPPDVDARVVYTRGYLVNATITTVAENLSLGAALVVVILLLILGNARAAFLVSLAIPVSMLCAATGMKLWGISANLMSLGAVDFGLLVDGSVVMIENLLRKMELRGMDAPPLTFHNRISFFLEAGREVVKPVVFGILIIMAVYVPILSLEGVEGKMFRPMALTVLMAIGASLVVAVIVMPAIAYLFLKFPQGKKRPPLFFRVIESRYRPALMASLSHRGVILALVLAVTVFSAVVFARMGSDFVPSLDEGDMSIAIVRDFSIGPTDAVEAQKKCERIIASYPEVSHVFAQTGTAESATDSMGIYMSDTFIILNKDRSAWPRVNGKRRTKQQLFDAIKKKIDAEIPGQEMLQSQPIELRFNEILEGSRADVTLRIYGNDLEVLSDLVEKAEALIKPIAGASEVEMDPITSLRRSPILNISLDHDLINRYGITIKDVNESVEVAMGGRRVGSFYEYDWRFPIVVKMAEEYRNDPAAIANIPVPLEEGGVLPLSAISHISEVSRVTNIARNGSRRYSAISINLADRDTLSYVNEAKKKIAENLKLPEGYGLYWGGQFKNLERARARLLIIVPLVLAVIFILILVNLGRVRQTLLVFMSIPFAMTGGVISLFLRGISFSVSASIGFIALSGIAILNSLVMVTLINQLRESGKGIREAVIEGAVTRLRPIVMTALVASLGFIPMAMNTGLGAEVQRPLATVVIGGLITSTILTLMLLPLLYIMVEKE